LKHEALSRGLRACGAFAGRSLVLALLAAAGASVHAAPKVTERSKQKAVVEAERAQVQKKLTELRRSIERTEDEKDEAMETLAASEQAISNANRALRELEEEQGATEEKARQLAAEHERLATTVAAQQKHLAGVLRQQYKAGNEDRIKLLLSGDNPNRINRDLKLMGYVSQAEARLIHSLRANLQAVTANQAQTENARLELAEIEQEQREQKSVLEQEKARRAALLAQVSTKLANQRRQAGTLLRDEQQRSALVTKLAQAIEEQRRAEALAAEKRRAEQAERERQAAAEKLRAQQQAKGKIKPAAPAEAPVVAANEPKPGAAKAVPKFSIADGAFAALRGRLSLPVRGTPAARFGSKRGDGPSWKGWFIRAETGENVKAVADGQVVFAEWMGRYGNLIMVDHGDGYLTIYGNNHTLFKRKDDMVKAGDTIAAAGNTGGNEESGLYFELRHKGAAIDPAAWIKY
jgi:septal ring factor EnvC (AmiA/AmiB activator)